jgi:hypothetical protein
MLHFAIILLAHSITCCLSPLVFIPNLPYPGSRLLAHALSVTIFDRHFTTSLVASKACFNPTDPKWWCNHFCSCAAIQPTRLSLKSPHVIHVVMYAPAHMVWIPPWLQIRLLIGDTFTKIIHIFIMYRLVMGPLKDVNMTKKSYNTKLVMELI